MHTPDYPEKWLQRMEQQLGTAYPAFRAALEQKPAISLRLNPRRFCPPFEGASPVPWCPGAVYLEERPRFVRDPHVHAGAYYVQEASSMFLAQLIDFSRDLRILDLCAAPGGKSTLIASLMSEGSVLVSNELVGDRAVILEENIIRWGDARVIVTCAHPKDFSSLRHTFDVIVVDAPCSGEGMFRKDRDTIAHWSPGAVRQCYMRQTDILRFVSGALSPGGRLIYSTCTYNQEENEDVVQWILGIDPGMYRVVEIPMPEAWGVAPGFTEGYPEQMRHVHHCYPHRVKGEGLFFAVLEKTRDGNDSFVHVRREIRNQKFQNRKKEQRMEREEERPRRQQPPRREMLALAATFVKEGTNLSQVADEENLWLQLPQVKNMLADLSGTVRVRRAGVKAGRISGQKFIPDHDLAMSGYAALRFARIEVDRENALRFLKRQEPEVQVPADTDWAIICYEGNPLGWVKAVEGRLNNHLPKNWRIRADVLDEFEGR